MNEYKQLILKTLKQLKEENNLNYDIVDNTKLLGTSGVMDSMDFVSFIMLLEENFLIERDIEITILTDKAFSRKNSPFQDVNHLSEFIEKELK